MSVDAQYEALIKMFNENRDQGKALTNNITEQEAQILKLNGHKYERVHVTFTNREGATAELFFDRTMGANYFDQLFNFVLNLRKETADGSRAQLQQLETKLRNYITAAESGKRPDVDEDDGDDGPDDEPPKSPEPPSGGKKNALNEKLRAKAKKFVPPPEAKKEDREPVGAGSGRGDAEGGV